MKKKVRASFGGRHAVRFFSAVVFALLLLCSSGREALAASSAAINPEAAGSIRLTIQDADGAEAAADGEAAVYRVAGLAEDSLSWVFTDAFADCGETLEDPDRADLAETLADYAGEMGIAETAVSVVENGEAIFTELPVGLYLVVQTEASSGFFPFRPFLAALPQDGGEEWVYDFDASPKIQTERIPEEETGTTETSAEPEGPSVLSDGSGSSDSGASSGTSGSSDSGVSSGTSGSSDSGISSASSARLPQTGQLNWPIPVLAVCGLFLIGLGSVCLYVRRPCEWDRTV